MICTDEDKREGDDKGYDDSWEQLPWNHKTNAVFYNLALRLVVLF